MNENDKFNQFPQEDRAALGDLSSLANSIQPDERFVKKTETQLKERFAINHERPVRRLAALWGYLAGTAALAILVFGMIWLVRGVAPEPLQLPAALPTARPVFTSVPTSTAIPTAAPTLPSYEAHGTTIKMAASFPQAPASAGLYTHAPEPALTMEIAKTLAQRFGIQGQVYQAAVDGSSVSELLVTDGKQRLYVLSPQRYTYSLDNVRAASSAPVSKELAAPVIDSFLKAHGFNFDYQLTAANGMGVGWFYVIPLAVEGRPIHFDMGIPQGLSLQVSPKGQVLMLDANLLAIDVQAAGQFGLISAEQAWNRYIDPTTKLGVLESFRSVNTDPGPQTWVPAYSLGVSIKLVGHVDSLPALEAGQPPFITLESTTLSGKTQGLENVKKEELVEAAGQFVEANAIRTFQVESWQVLTQYSSASFQEARQGNLRKAGDKIIFSTDGVDYELQNVPTDLPLPLTDASVNGYILGARFEWQSINWFNGQNHGGGGGGGGGSSFAKLNLSGTPVPWPTPQGTESPPTSGSVTGQSLDGQQGILLISIHEKADGSRRTEYGFSDKETFYILQGDGLAALEPYQNRPVTIWGTLSGFNTNQTPIVTVQRFEIPYPDLKFQILGGTQKLTTLAGQSVSVLKAVDGNSYAQLSPTGMPTNMLIGIEGDAVEFEVLIIPGETFGGLPAMRTFAGGLAVSPKTGQPAELKITANQPQVLTDSAPDSTTPPTLTIETIELVYYTGDPRYALSYPQAMSPYLQPVWRFYGHYSDGQEAEILIQALQQQYLLPEAAPAVQGG